MLSKLKDFLSSNLGQALGLPATLSGVTFFSNVVQTLKDGQITSHELQGLISSTSGIETLILIGLMILMRKS